MVEMNDIEISSELSAKLKAAGINSLAVFVMRSHDQERIDAIGLDHTDVVELNLLLRKADVMLVLVPVPIPAAGLTARELSVEMAEVFGHVFDAARLCSALLAEATAEPVEIKLKETNDAKDLRGAGSRADPAAPPPGDPGRR